MTPPRPCLRPTLWLAALLLCLLPAAAQTTAPANPTGVKVSYQLPTDGPLPKTYLVTLAVVDPKDPNWVISNFAAGAARTVTADNQGKFSETWDGLDDNYMPVPPGNYAIKGIYSPAEKWAIDGQYHALIPKLASSGSSWAQTPAEDTKPNIIEGDSVNSPFRAVSVTPEGKGVLLFQYLENAMNNYPIDFTKPIGYDQIAPGFGSGSAAGGFSTCTDGTTVWSFIAEGGPKFIYRPDGQPFGSQDSAGRHNVTLPEGWVKAMAAWKSDSGTVVFAAEGGRIVQTAPKRYEESDADLVDKVIALNGANAQSLGEWKMEHPLGLAVRNGKLYALHQAGTGFVVETIPLDADWQKAQFTPLFTVPANIHPYDVTVDSRSRVYLSDPDANHVYQFDPKGQLLHTFGKLDSQQDNAYDPQTFMSPQKIATWTGADGKDRLLVVEQAGPNRLSEWDGDGNLLRQWVTPQLTANMGYAPDPRHPDLIYANGQMGTIVRWKIDYQTGQWTVDAVWQKAGNSQLVSRFMRHEEIAGRPTVLYHGDDLYLAFAHAHNPFIARLENGHFRACTAIFHVPAPATKGNYVSSLWRDLNGDGQVQDNECVPFDPGLPPGTIIPRAFGDNWADDFSLVAIGQGTPDIWQLPVNGFDEHGNPIFDPKGWKKLLTDDTFVAKKAGNATALRGANEVGTAFSSDWSSVAPAPDGGYYVDARSGPNLTANYGTQFKLSRYVPDGKGGLVQRWRVGRIAMMRNAVPGEVYGPIFVSPPVNGLVSVIDNSRAGAVVYTEDGLYVDSILADPRETDHDARGAYWNPGEFFAGIVYPDKDNGKVYLGVGKTFPVIFEIPGWTTSASPVHPLNVTEQTVSIAAAQIAAPPAISLQVRGGAAASHVARFYPAPGGGPALDGSMKGWEACDPVVFSSGQDQAIEARCYYDPDHLYIRWHARLGHAFQPRSLVPAEHLFAHDRQADTLGLYLQGDPNAPPGGTKPQGRPGDVRFVFGIFQDGGALKPVVLGMYPTWTGGGGSPITYSTAQVTHFENVALVPGVNAGFKIDEDNKGFVIAAAIPRAAIPGSPTLSNWSTQGNFDANLGGGDRFWWSNADGSASREVFDEPTEARLFPGSWSPIQFFSMDALPVRSWMVIGPFGFPALATLDYNKDRPEITKTLTSSVFPPDSTRDMTATYDGDNTRTRVAQRKLAWRDAELSVDLIDQAKLLGWKGYNDEGTDYMLTHIYSPDAAQVTLKLVYPHGQGIVTGQLNGKVIPKDQFVGASVTDKGPQHTEAAVQLALQPGWNEVLIRQDRIWGAMEFGGSLVADPATLWKLQVSGPPPTSTETTRP
jgi:hypothetical protein